MRTRRTASPQGLARAVRAADDRALRWVADTDHGPLRPVLVGTARAADVLAPWIAVSLVALVTGTRAARTAVVHGWTGMAVAAVAEDAVVKPATERGRPDIRRLPPRQRRRTDPSTSGFPSGHIGSATAFAVAAGADVPALRLPLAATAAVVAYARVYTGRHYLSDALVGVAMGLLAGALVRRLRRAGGPGPAEATAG